MPLKRPRDGVSRFLRCLPAQFGAVEERHQRSLFQSGGVQHRGKRVVRTCCGCSKLAVEYRDRLPLLDVYAVYRGRAYSRRDLARPHAVERAPHRLGVLLACQVGIECQHGRHALRDVARRDDGDRRVGELRGLLRSEHDVLVVRQDDGEGGIRLLHRGDNVGRARVHRLPARDRRPRAEASEDARDAVARCDRDHREFHRLHLLRRFLAVSVERHELLMLQVHVLDVDLVERAECCAHTQQRTRVFCVCVDAHNTVVARPRQSMPLSPSPAHGPRPGRVVRPARRTACSSRTSPLPCARGTRGSRSRRRSPVRPPAP